MSNPNAIIQLIDTKQYDKAKDAARDTRDTIAELRDELAELKEENRQLKEKLQKKEEVIYSAPYYYLKSDTNFSDPLCPKCYSEDHKVIYVHPDANSPGVKFCPSCKTSFGIQGGPRTIARM